MLKKFTKYITQSIAGMVGISSMFWLTHFSYLYIPAQTDWQS